MARFMRRRRAFRRRSTPFRRRTIRRARPIRRVVRRVVQSLAEKKHNTFNYNVPSEIDWSGRIHHISNLVQGVGNNQRVGDSIQPTSLTWKFGFTNNNAEVDRTVSMLIVRDNQQIGDSTPTMSTLLENINDVSAPYSLINSQTAGRFSVLYRRTFVVGDRNSDNDTVIKQGTLKFKAGSSRIRYNGTLGSDIQRNGIYFMFVSDQDPAADNVYITGMMRLWFVDT